MDFLNKLSKVLNEQDEVETEAGEMKGTEQEIKQDLKSDIGGDIDDDKESYIRRDELTEILKNFVGQEQFGEFLKKLEDGLLDDWKNLKRTFKGFKT